MLLRFNLQAEDAARAIERAVEEAITAGFGTGDIGGRNCCRELAERLADAVKR